MKRTGESSKRDRLWRSQNRPAVSESSYRALSLRTIADPFIPRSYPVHIRPYPHRPVICARPPTRPPGTGLPPSGCPSTTGESGLTCVCRTSTMDGWTRMQSQVRTDALSSALACLEALTRVSCLLVCQSSSSVVSLDSTRRSRRTRTAARPRRTARSRGRNKKLLYSVITEDGITSLRSLVLKASIRSCGPTGRLPRARALPRDSLPPPVQTSYLWS